MMDAKKLDHLRVYVYIFLFAIVLLPILFGKNISLQFNRAIAIVTIIALLLVAIVEAMRYF